MTELHRKQVAVYVFQLDLCRESGDEPLTCPSELVIGNGNCEHRCRPSGLQIHVAIHSMRLLLPARDVPEDQEALVSVHRDRSEELACAYMLKKGQRDGVEE